jgi:hypothetical protein
VLFSKKQQWAWSGGASLGKDFLLSEILAILF